MRLEEPNCSRDVKHHIVVAAEWHFAWVRYDFLGDGFLGVCVQILIFCHVLLRRPRLLRPGWGLHRRVQEFVKSVAKISQEPAAGKWLQNIFDSIGAPITVTAGILSHIAGLQDWQARAKAIAPPGPVISQRLAATRPSHSPESAS